ncbi:MAG: histidinol-phosphate transaminase [Acidimicrobiia bacterium]|nr:MAG: histidinol-phosphate transaminase [Acidimicrobiia bacterium]
MPTYRTDLQAIPTYSPGKPIAEVSRELGIPDICKLASNECPVEPFAEVVAAIAAAAPDVNRYPEDSGYYLVNSLAERHGVEPAQVWLGAGSTQLLGCVALSVGGRGTSAVYAKPSFVMYAIASLVAGTEPIEVPLDEGWTHDLDAMKAAIREDTTVVYVCNPNNPTGTYRSEADMAAFIDAIPAAVLVVVDEAYHDYVTAPDYATALPIASEQENVIVTRTFSKIYGLAGLRIGYAIGDADTIAKLKTTQPPFSTNSVAQVAALESLAHDGHLAERVDSNTAGRLQLEHGLTERGIEHAPSQTNFVAMATDESAELAHRLLEQGVIVRPMGPIIRVTVGTEEENRRFLRALDAVGFGS